MGAIRYCKHLRTHVVENLISCKEAIKEFELNLQKKQESQLSSGKEYSFITLQMNLR